MPENAKDSTTTVQGGQPNTNGGGQDFSKLDVSKLSPELQTAFSELQKGYLRQDDYTKKSQANAEEKKKLETIRQSLETRGIDLNSEEGIKAFQDEQDLLDTLRGDEKFDEWYKSRWNQNPDAQQTQQPISEKRMMEIALAATAPLRQDQADKEFAEFVKVHPDTEKYKDSMAQLFKRSPGLTLDRAYKLAKVEAGDYDKEVLDKAVADGEKKKAEQTQMGSRPVTIPVDLNPKSYEDCVEMAKRLHGAK